MDRLAFAAVLLLALLPMRSSLASTSPPDPAVERRVEALLAQMTLAEKLAYIGGYKGFNVMPVERLGIPELVMADGPAGVRNFGPTTAYPAPITLAASWDEPLALEFGDAIGRDSRARGVHIWLGPGVNLTRQPHGGRNFEYFGEDPHLTARMAVGVIRGVQSRGVVATVKHFIANEQEHDRHTVSSELDERTLREVYLRPFHAAVTEAGAWAVMTSYNLVNGVHASESEPLIKTLLKEEWSFPGPVMSDWTSVYSTLGPVRAGLDLEMPVGVFMTEALIAPLLDRGDVTQAIIDDKVRRILRMAVSMGFLDRPQLDDSIPRDDPVTAATALRIARRGIVLLKNDAGILPLSPTRSRRILVLGPNAHPSPTGGGGSSYTTPHRAVSVVDALRALPGDWEVVHHPVGMSPEREAAAWSGYALPDGGPGLMAEYFANMDLAGPPVATRVEPGIDHDWSGRGPVDGIGPDDFSVRWTGRIVADRAGDHTLIARSDDGMRVFVDGAPVIDMWRDQAATKGTARLSLSPGEGHDLRVEYYQRKGGAIAQFGIVETVDRGDRPLPAAALAAADVVIACVGFDRESEYEGADRPFELPPEQESMLRRLVRAHPRVVVVLNAGASVDATGWIDDAAAVLMAWYPGQNGNTALAEILTGAINPSGRLPVTFERDFAESYAAKGYPPEKDGTLRYDEGVFVGYRHFDRHALDPLFCFGHGLSYTTFRYTDLRVTPGAPGEGPTVSVSVENSGDVPGDEVVQLYISDPDPSLPRPLRELKEFRRVTLRPGEAREIEFTLTPGALARWDLPSRAWSPGRGRFEVFVGSSSRDLPLRATFEIPD